MISNEVSVEIETLRKQGMSLRRIAAEVGCAVNTERCRPYRARTKGKLERFNLKPSVLTHVGAML